MHIYPFYYSTLSSQLLISDLYRLQQQQQYNMSNSATPTPTSLFFAKNSNCCPQQQEEQQEEGGQKKILQDTINHYQNEIDHLFYEWNTINIVLESIRNAFTIKENATEEHLDEVDKELSIAYDDLMSQVRHLERRLKKMSNEINQKLIVQQQHLWKGSSLSNNTNI